MSVAGDLRHREFAAASAWLKLHAVVLPLEDAGDDGPVDVIVLACARRGQFTARDVRRLRNTAPLARIVALAGSWCDGPWRRACDALAGVTIVPWHRWPAWAEVNRQQLVHRIAASWSLPQTATTEELADFWSEQPLGENRGLILIDSDNAETAEMLADVVRSGGFAAVWQSPRSEAHLDGVHAIVCEVDDARPASLERIAQLSRQFAAAPVVVVINFPRTEDITRFFAAGAAGVVGKPFTLHEILAQLGDALRRKGNNTSFAA